MTKVTVFRRVLVPSYEPVSIEESDLVTQKEAAEIVGRTVQDISTAIRTGRVVGYTFTDRDIRQAVYILRSDIPLLQKHRTGGSGRPASKTRARV